MPMPAMTIANLGVVENLAGAQEVQIYRPIARNLVAQDLVHPAVHHVEQRLPPEKHRTDIGNGVFDGQRSIHLACAFVDI
jgi:hypothetical protein